jgi:hypothetical protein
MPLEVGLGISLISTAIAYVLGCGFVFNTSMFPLAMRNALQGHKMKFLSALHTPGFVLTCRDPRCGRN